MKPWFLVLATSYSIVARRWAALWQRAVLFGAAYGLSRVES
ncbi:MAG: hypothetical protein ACREF4_22965 [Gammaproteobacteria bacterium]